MFAMVSQLTKYRFPSKVLSLARHRRQFSHGRGRPAPRASIALSFAYPPRSPTVLHDFPAMHDSYSHSRTVNLLPYLAALSDRTIRLTDDNTTYCIRVVIYWSSLYHRHADFADATINKIVGIIIVEGVGRFETRLNIQPR